MAGLEGRLDKMLTRTIWGIIAAVIAFFIIMAGGIYLTLTIGALTTLAVLEYVELLKKQNLRPQTEVIIGISLLILTFIQANQFGLINENLFRSNEQLISFMLVAAFFILLIFELLRGDPNQGLINVAVNLFGIVYIGLMFAFFLLLRFMPDGDGFFYMLSTAFITFANDTAAYFIGIKFGRHKLSPKISPKKSVEGSIGGLLGGLVIAVVIGLFFHKPIWLMLLLGAMIVIAGQFGDLIESIIKRNAGVKDSGMFLPGHGGVLDRIDSLLLSAPVVYYFITYFRI